MWVYQNRPTHSAFHDLTTTIKPSSNLRSLLGLGLNFITTPRYSTRHSAIRDSTLPRLQNSLHLKFHFAGETMESDYNKKLYQKSNWTPPPYTFPPQLLPRMDAFDIALQKIFRRQQSRPNLLPHQQRALKDLTSQNQLLVVPCDKNLGPSVIERSRYIQMALQEHLTDANTYRRLHFMTAQQAVVDIKLKLKKWMTDFKNDISKSEMKFLKAQLKSCVDPFSRFYLTMKVHKLLNGNPLTSRPIVSCPGSVMYPLGLWTNDKLQHVAKLQTSYLKNSFELVQEMKTLDIPPFRARLFTADAVSMYTNIPTTEALRAIKVHFDANTLRYQMIPLQATYEALRLVMKNNIFKFGDLTFLQKNGTAMGTPPAPPYATIYMAITEDTFLDRFRYRLLLYRRFLDDVIGIWLSHPNPDEDAIQWQDFQDCLNQAPGLTWLVSERSNQVDFMDLTITLKEGIVHTTLFEKALNLHLYIPPHSAHPPGLLPGMVFGTIFRVYTLCSDPADRFVRTQAFFRRLRARGWSSGHLMPVFLKAIERAATYTGPSIDNEANEPFLIFHLQFHPNDPSSRHIQQAWRDTVSEPRNQVPLCDIVAPKSRKKTNIRRMILAYSRPMNLGNQLSHRRLDRHQGPPVSSFL